MELLVTSAGSYPRIGDDPGEDRLRAAVTRWERTKADRVDVLIAQDILIRQAIEEQTRSGVDWITDGLIGWNDPISYFPEKLDGIRLGGLVRYYDTHLHFRQPVVTGKLAWVEPTVAADYMTAQAYAHRPVKAVLTGPLTLGKNTMVRSSAYKTLSELVLAYASAVAREVGMLAGLGATVIQIDEPAVLDPGVDIGLIGEAMAIVGQWKGSSRLLLNTFFGEAVPIFHTLQTFPVDIIGVDLVSDPKLVDVIATDGSDKALSLGLLDGRNTRMEDPFHILEILNRVADKIRAGPCLLSSSCGLEFLPKEKARKKLERACEIKRLFTNGGLG